MEEINLKDLFSYFVKKIPIMICITLSIFLLGLVYISFFKVALYSGDTTLILVQDSSNSSAVTQSDLAMNKNLVSTYTEIIKSRRVLDQVIERLSLEYSYEELYSLITVSNVSDTEIIKISVSDESSVNAATIANTIATVFKNEIVEIYSLQNVSIIDRAQVDDVPYNIHTIRDLIIFFIIGIVVSVIVIFVVYYFDTSVKSSEEIEEKLKVTVLGSVPLYKKRKSA